MLIHNSKSDHISLLLNFFFHLRDTIQAIPYRPQACGPGSNPPPHLLHFSMHSTCLCTMPCPSPLYTCCSLCQSALARLQGWQTQPHCERSRSRVAPQVEGSVLSLLWPSHDQGSFALSPLQSLESSWKGGGGGGGGWGPSLNCSPWSLTGRWYVLAACCST